MQELIEKYYSEFRGLPANCPIVRNNQKNDAFEIVVLEILFGKYLDLHFDCQNVSEISKYIIAPPDSGIDIFVQKGTSDDPEFHVIQVKNSELQEAEIKSAVATMKRTIDDFCKNPLNIASQNCRAILSESDLDKNNKQSCQYYVVHSGTVRDFHGSKPSEHVLTITDLKLLKDNISDRVPQDTLSVDEDQNIILYGNDDGQSAIVCNLCGFDLANLCLKYYSTEIGRNILFGQNLRESINAKKSKSYSGMKNTVANCPENFWYYNNGITIIAENANISELDGKKAILLKNFSIVNGAQTTSALGTILREARRDGETSLLENIKKVFVLSRILTVNNSDAEHNIAIYNNTQNPITSRDMVSNREEQIALHKRLLDDQYPQIYMETRNGATVPATFNKHYAHRMTTNEELAQLAFASFRLAPYTAKDNKRLLFNNDYNQNDYVINSIYHQVFAYFPDNPQNSGILFQKEKVDIDEALFIQFLYKEVKKSRKKTYEERLETQLNLKATETDPDQLSSIESRIKQYSRQLETVGVCMFYFITLYYEFLTQFGTSWRTKRYDYDKFYSDKAYRNQLIKDVATTFMDLTISLLTQTAKDNNKEGNINNWVRSAKGQEAFLSALRSEIGTKIELEDKFRDFMNQYKKIELS